MAALAKLKLVMEIDGDKAVVTGMERVDAAIDRTARTSQTATERMASGMGNVETATGRMAAGMGGAETATGMMMTAAGGLYTMLQRVIGAWASWEILQKGKDVTMFAANMEMAERALGVVGNATGHTVEKMAKYRDGLKDINITSMSSTSTIAMMARAGLDLNGAIPLARLAQGAARMAALNGETVSSSEALTRMLHGIVSMQPEVLKLFGITTTVESAMRKYKQTTGESAESLNEQQKAQMFFNAVLENGQPLMNLYVNTLDLAASKISSSQRPVEELKLALGQLFLPELNVAATAYYNTVSGGMKWVRAHSAELTAAKLVIKDWVDAVGPAIMVATAYAAVVGITTVATGGLTTGTGALTGVLAIMTTEMSLTGAATAATTIQVGLMGESVLVASSKATMGLLSIKTVFGVLAASIIGYEIGTYLSNEFEFARQTGAAVVGGLIELWNRFIFVLQRVKASANPFGNGDEQIAALNRINEAEKQWKITHDQTMAAVFDANKTAPEITATKPFQNDQTAIALAKKQAADAAAAAAASAAEKAAQEAKDLAEKQAQYDKQVADAKSAVTRQYIDNDRRLTDAQTKENLAQLQYEHDMGLRSVQSFLDGKYAMERQAGVKELASAREQVTALQTTLDAMKVNPAVDTLMFKQEEHKLAQAKGAVELLQQKLNSLPAEQDREQAKAYRDQIDAIEKLNVDLLKLQGNERAAADASIWNDYHKQMDAAVNGMLSAVSPEEVERYRIIIELLAGIIQKKTELGATAGESQRAALAIAQINNQLAQVDMAEKTYSLSTEQATQRRIELFGQQLVAQQAVYDSITGNESVDKIARQQTQDQIVAINKSLLDQQLILRDRTAIGGMTNAVQEYGKAADDVGAQVETTWLDVFKGIEDSMVNAFMTGKLSLDSFVKTFEADLARLFIKTQMMGPLVAGMSSSLMGSAAVAGTASTAASAATPGLIGGLTAPGAGSMFGAEFMAGYTGGMGMFASGSMAASIGAVAGVVAPIALAAAGAYVIGKFGFGWGNSYKSIGSGVNLNISDGQVSGQTWEEFKKKGGWFTSDKYRTDYKALTDTQSLLLQDTLDTINTGLKRDAQIMGLSATDTKSILDQLVTTGNVTGANAFKKYTEEKLLALFPEIGHYVETFHQELVSDATYVYDEISGTNVYVDAVYQSVSDGMHYVAGVYSRTGEDATATGQRILGSIEVMRTALELIGQGVQSLDFAAGNSASNLMDKFNTSTKDGENNGAANFTQATKNYASSGIFSANEQAANALTAATDQVNTLFSSSTDIMTQLGVTVPKTNEDFQRLVATTLSAANANDAGSDAAGTFYMNLLGVSDAFAVTTKSAADLAASLTTTLATALGKTVDTALSAANAIRDIQGGSLSTDSPAEKLRKAQEAFRSASDANAGETGKSYLSALQTMYASGQGYQTGYAEVMTRLQGISGSTATTQIDRQIQLLTDIKTALTDASSPLVSGITATGLKGNSTITNITDSYNTTITAAEQLAARFSPDNYAAPVSTPVNNYKQMSSSDYSSIGGAIFNVFKATHPNDTYWKNLTTGVEQWLPNGALPSFAVGTPYLQQDGPIYAHQGEIIMDRASSDVLRKYGIPTKGSSDNKGIEERLDKAVRALESLERKLENIEGDSRLRSLRQ